MLHFAQDDRFVECPADDFGAIGRKSLVSRPDKTGLPSAFHLDPVEWNDCILIVPGTRIHAEIPDIHIHFMG